MVIGSKDWYSPQTAIVASYIKTAYAQDNDQELYDGLTTKIFYLTSWWIDVNNNTGVLRHGELFLTTNLGAPDDIIVKLWQKPNMQNSLSLALPIPFAIPSGYGIALLSDAVDVLVNGGIMGYEKYIET